MKRNIYGVMLATLTMGATTMASEVITPADIDCSPTDQPVGRLLIASNRDFKRYGEGSFIVGTDGRLLLFYDRRKGSGDLDKSVIAVKQSLDRGKTWSGEKVVFEDEEASVIQPSLCRMANGQMGMTFSRILLADKYKAAKLFTSSADEGESWSTPVPVSGRERSYMTGAHDRLAVVGNGRLISLVHAKTKPRRPHHLVSYVYTSDDHGTTWVNRTPESLDVDLHPFPSSNQEFGFWETSLVELGKGALLLYGRTATGWIYESRSEDSGTTWSKPAKTPIPNPLAPMRLTRVPDTEILLMVRNPLVDMKAGWHGGVRRVLAFQTSSDGGRSWSRCRQLEFVKQTRQWFDYPFLLWDGDLLHLGYRAPMEGSFECSIYYQRIQRSKLLESAEQSPAGDVLKAAPEE